MEKTTNYDQFKMITSNREVDEKHVKRLCASIEANNLLHLNPIVVNKAMEIIDGQHRLEAARRLGFPIYFIIGDVNKKDISALNRISKKWNMMDYINFYTIEGRENFKRLSKFLNKYPKIKVSSAVFLLTSEANRRTEPLKEGFIDIGNENVAYTIAQVIEDLNEKYDFVWDRSFIMALRKCFDNPLFCFPVLKTKLDNYASRDFVKCHTVTDYLKMISEIYNYHLAEKNRVTLL